MIQLKNVSKYYYSKGMVSSGISKVNLKLEPGEFVVITGESGSGKTTLLNVISGLDSYEDGEMYINGKETSHFLTSDFEEYRKKHIGNIFQNFNLINSYTVYQNIELILMINGYPGKEIKTRVNDIIRRVGLEAYTSTKVSRLSGGQKQRVAIARALAKDTEIIVADEPTGNLDSISAAGIVELLSEISYDKLVIVVTHNYEQFAQHATRKIQMHDGSVVEDLYVKRGFYAEVSGKAAVQSADAVRKDRNISIFSKIRLGFRNTFNIVPKFFLMTAVFLFVVAAVMSQYTALLNQSEEENSLGYNDYFTNYSEDRIVVKKSDGKPFREADLDVIRDLPGVSSIAVNDILLDKALYIEDENFSYEVCPKSISNLKLELEAGRVPQTSDEVVFTALRSDVDDRIIDSIVGRTFKVSIDEEKEINVTVTGFAYKAQEPGAFMYTGELYATDDLLNTLLTETYNGSSTVKTEINGKEQRYQPGNPFYRIIPNSRVTEGNALASEEIGNFFKDGRAKGRKITVTAENLFYTESAELRISSTYNKKNFQKLTNVTEFEENNGTIYISQKDYDRLFRKGNFQITVYADGADAADPLAGDLASKGYVTLSLKDTLINMYTNLSSIIRVPAAVLLMAALFFIAYFVIRLILRSRESYFNILRMLGLSKKNIRRVLDVEMLLVVNIAFAVFLLFIASAVSGILPLRYISGLVQYMEFSDYVILYLLVTLTAYLISGKFARRLFRNTAMGNYREEE